MIVMTMLLVGELPQLLVADTFIVYMPAAAVPQLMSIVLVPRPAVMNAPAGKFVQV